jgi:subtilisin family serine protease
MDIQAGDDTCLIGTPAVCRDVISVAAVNSRLNYTDIDGKTQTWGQTRLHDVATFSSPGPLRTCSARLLSLFGLNVDLTHPAIDIAAPGAVLVSALSSAMNINPGTPPNPAIVQFRTQVVNQNALADAGTSMAAPLVAGLVACMLSAEPKLTQDQVRDRIRAAGKLPAPAATVFKTGTTIDENAWGPGLIHSPDLKKP